MTEQEKRDRVIKGLEICKEDSKLCFGESECDYQSCFPRCWITLASDALALLKAQEPRVMSLEEVQRSDSPIFVEGINNYGQWGLVVDEFLSTFHETLKPEGTEILFIEYGKTWRCWTSRPTNAQREATPWED